MNILELVLTPALILCIISLPFIAFLGKKKSPKKARNAIIANLCSFFAVLALAVIFPIGSFVSAETAEAANGLTAKPMAMYIIRYRKPRRPPLVWMICETFWTSFPVHPLTEADG